MGLGRRTSSSKLPRQGAPKRRSTGKVGPGRTTPVTRTATPAPRPPAPMPLPQPDSDIIEESPVEVMLGDEPEDTGSVQVDDVPGTPARTPSGRRTPAGRAKRATTGTARKSPAGRSSGGQPRSEPQRHAGAEIGRLQRRGMGLAMKFSLFISLLILLISLLFGLVVIRLFKERMKEEIVRSGYQQALVLQPTAKRMHEHFRTWLQDKSTKFDKYVDTPDYKQDSQILRQIKEGDPRIHNLAVFAEPNPRDFPTGLVAVASDDISGFQKPESADWVERIPDLEESDIQIWWAPVQSSSAEASRALIFMLPVEKQGEDRYFATAMLMLSAQQIDDEVQSLIRKIGLFGLLFVAAGIALSLGLASLVTSPINVLVRDMDIVARGDLQHETRPQTSDEIGLLAMAFNRMTKSIKAAREQEREIDRINSDLSVLKEIHAKLMPAKLPQIPGFDIFTGYYCAKEVGGDYYDFVPVDRDHLAFVIADVSGKGIPGSMYMGYTRTVLRMMAPDNPSPADVLIKTNYHVARDIKRGMFVTAMYAIVNVRTKMMTVASAGHNPMSIYRHATKTHEKIRPNGIALGFDKGPIFDRTIREQKIQLYKGDRVLLYTDGVVEAMNEDHDEWGDEALDEFIKEHAEKRSKDFVRLLLAALEDHKGAAEQHDDITLTTFRIE